ncbi:MAG TPA: hypothetical protein VH500_24400 [Nitrososphaeraceae archaeon]
MGYTSVRKCNHIEIRTKFNLIHEKEWIGDTWAIFVRDTVYPEKHTTSGTIDTK